MTRSGRVAAILGFTILAGCESKLPAPKPDTVTVTLAPAQVSADAASTIATALVTEKRVPLEGFTVSFQVTLTASTGANPTYAAVTAITDVNGIATVTLSGLSIAGDGAATGTAMRELGDGTFEPYLDETDAPIAGSTALSVLPGVAASVATTLSTSQVDLDLQDFLEVSYVVRDSQANRTDDLVEITTDHPGATVLGNRIAGLSAAGTWEVAVSVVGRPEVSDTESYLVGAGNAKIIDVFLSKYTTDAYAQPDAIPSVVVGFLVSDTRGNAIAAPAGTACGISTASGAAVNPITFAIDPLVVKGTFPVTCSFLDGGNVVADTETLTVIDLRPPTMTILEPIAGSTVASGAGFNVRVRAQDVVSVSQITANVVGLGVNDFQSQLVTSLVKDVTVDFPFNAGNGFFGNATMTIYALGEDGSANKGTAPSVTINVSPFAQIDPGISVALVREDPQFAAPTAIAADPLSAAMTPDLYVADPFAFGGTVWKVTYDRASATSTKTAFLTGVGANLRGVEWNAAGTYLYVTVLDDVRVHDRTGALRATFNFPGGFLQHLVFGDAPYLYVADGATDAIRRVSLTNSTAGTVVVVPFADNGTPRTGGGPALNTPGGIEYDAATGSLFTSDLGASDVIYELLPDANANNVTDSLRVLMQTGSPFGPNPDVPTGLLYKGAGGPYANRLFSANIGGGTDELHVAQRDDALGVDANVLSDEWHVFLEGLGRAPVDMAFHPNGRMYVLFEAGNGMDPHLVELGGF